MSTSSKNIIWALVVTAILVVSFFVMSTNNNDQAPKERKIDSIEGLDITVLQEGSGDKIQNGNIAVVHYTGSFEDGTVFDSSVSRGVPFKFLLGAGQVIRGWDLGVLGMRVGEKRRLIIAPELAYGPNGRGSIPPNATLIFEVELLGIN